MKIKNNMLHVCDSRLRRVLLASAVSIALVSLGAPIAVADDDGLPSDSSSNSAAGFDALMTESNGVLVRVPVNEKGEENTDLAELRAYAGDTGVVESGDLKTAWEKGTDIASHPMVANEDVSSNAAVDSSTSNYHWNNWRGHGWSSPGYYNNYRPNYYSHYYYNNYRYNNSYYYGAPVWRSYNNGYFGNYLNYYPRYNTYWYPRVHHY